MFQRILTDLERKKLKKYLAKDGERSRDKGPSNESKKISSDHQIRSTSF